LIIRYQFRRYTTGTWVDTELEELNSNLDIDWTSVPEIHNISLEDSFDFTPLNHDDDEDDNNGFLYHPTIQNFKATWSKLLSTLTELFL
jgi:hypothetical protein